MSRPLSISFISKENPAGFSLSACSVRQGSTARTARASRKRAGMADSQRGGGHEGCVTRSEGRAQGAKDSAVATCQRDDTPDGLACRFGMSEGADAVLPVRVADAIERLAT